MNKYRYIHSPSLDTFLLSYYFLVTSLSYQKELVAHSYKHVSYGAAFLNTFICQSGRKTERYEEI